MVSAFLRIPGGPRRNLGQVEAGGKVFEKFRLVNNGRQNVLLRKKVDTSCGCTYAKLSSETIRPGEGVDLELALNVPGSYAPSQRVTAVVHVQQPIAQSPVVVEIQYDSYLPWIVKPGHLRLVGRPGEACSGTIDVMAMGDRRIRIEKVEYEGLSLKLDWKDVDENGLAQIQARGAGGLSRRKPGQND